MLWTMKLHHSSFISMGTSNLDNLNEFLFLGEFILYHIIDKYPSPNLTRSERISTQYLHASSTILKA